MKAPGSPTTKTLRLAVSEAMLTNWGGKPKWRSTGGILEPGVIAAKAAAYPPKWAVAAAKDARTETKNRIVDIFKILIFFEK